MDIIQYLPIIAVVIVVLISRRNLQKEMMRLPTEERRSFFRLFSSSRLMQYVGVLGVLIPALLLSGEGDVQADPLFAALLVGVALLAMIFWQQRFLLMRRKLEAESFPDSLLRAWLSDHLLLTLILIGFFLFASYGYYSSLSQ